MVPALATWVFCRWLEETLIVVEKKVICRNSDLHCSLQGALFSRDFYIFY